MRGELFVRVPTPLVRLSAHAAVLLHFTCMLDFLLLTGCMPAHSTHAERDACTRDFQRAIRLAEADPDGRTLTAHEGLDPLAQRAYLLAYSHYQLGGIMQRKCVRLGYCGRGGAGGTE